MGRGPQGGKLGYVTIAPGVTKQAWIIRATKPVILKGEIDHFRNGIAGLTFSCAFSKMWEDPKNSTRIPHPVRSSVIIKTQAFINTGEFKGTLVYVKYSHNYGTLVDMNDEKLVEMMIKNHPEELEQEFEFHVPPKVKRSFTPSVKKASTGKRRPFFPKGAIERARKAGLISLEEAQRQARESHDAYEMQRLIGAGRRR